MRGERTYEEINDKIKQGTVVVVTAEELVPMADELGVEGAFDRVDVVTCGTFGAMCSSGAFLNFGHADPPIRMSRVWLNDVPAYGGVAAVDAYIGVTEWSETRGIAYGGADVIEDLISGRDVHLRATSCGTDCYPATEVDTYVTKDTLNQAFLFNPRNCYQNYNVAVNSSGQVLHTYMGTLLPNLGNATYSSAGELSPLLCDPYYRFIGVGTRVFLGGTEGYVAWQGTQHRPSADRGPNGVPTSPAGTLALIGDLKAMSRDFVRAARFHGYGVTLYIGVGAALPMIDAGALAAAAVANKDICAPVLDYGVPRRGRPILGRVSYADLRSGAIDLAGRRVPTAPLSSLYKARQVAETLKARVRSGSFTLTQPVAALPLDTTFQPLDIRRKGGA